MKYTENYSVTSHDVDVNNNLRPSLIFRYMQETANHQMRDRKPTYYDLFFDGKSFIVSRMSVEICDQIHQYDDITVSTWRCPSKAATFIRCYSIEKDGRIMAKAYSEWAVVNRETGKLFKTTEVDIENYELDETVDFGIPTRFRYGKSMEFAHAGEHVVRYSDVDMNLHMNNTNYPDILWNFIPNVQNKTVSSINLRFMKEAPLDERIDISMLREDDFYGTETKGELYCFKTKVEAGTNVEAVIGVENK